MVFLLKWMVQRIIWLIYQKLFWNFDNLEEYIQDFNQNLNKDDSINLKDNIFNKFNDKNMKINDYFH